MELKNKNEGKNNEEKDKKENSGINFDEENLNEEEEDTKENEDDEEFEISSTSSSSKRKKRLVYVTFDVKYDYNNNYFYQELKEDELKEIRIFIEKFLSNKLTNKDELSNFFIKYPNIIKGNAEKVKQILNESSEKYPNLPSFKIINDYIINEYYTPKPSICECYFFPDGANEKKVVNILRTCKKTLDIAIFTFTLESITKAILEVYNRGIPVRIICDNECEKHSTSKIKKLASVGIVCKTDNCSYYMHHKFAIIDNSVVITGSFNWSSQAVNHNQENILFLENKIIAQQYTDEFNKLWGNYNTIIDKEEAIKYLEEKERVKKEKLEKKIKKEREKMIRNEEKQREKEKKLMEKENERLEKQKERERMLIQKEMEKKQRQKDRETQKIEKQKEKERIAKEKEKIKIEKKKEKEKEKESQKKESKTSKKEKVEEEKLKSKK